MLSGIKMGQSQMQAERWKRSDTKGFRVSRLLEADTCHKDRGDEAGKVRSVLVRRRCKYLKLARETAGLHGLHVQRQPT